jgi:hypothetical protein
MTDHLMTEHPSNVVTFGVTEGIFGVGRLASRLKSLESINQIGPWHVGHWTDYTHTAIRIRFSSDADGEMASRTCVMQV